MMIFSNLRLDARVCVCDVFQMNCRNEMMEGRRFDEGERLSVGAKRLCRTFEHLMNFKEEKSLEEENSELALFLAQLHHSK